MDCLGFKMSSFVQYKSVYNDAAIRIRVDYLDFC